MKKLIAIILTFCTLVLCVSCTDANSNANTSSHTQSTHPDAMEGLPIDSSIDDDIKKLSITEKQEIDGLVAGSGEIVEYDMAVDSNGNFYMVLSTDKDLFKLVRKTGDGFEVLGEGAVSEFPRYPGDENRTNYAPYKIHIFFDKNDIPYVSAIVQECLIIYRYNEAEKKIEEAASHKLYYEEDHIFYVSKRITFDEAENVYFQIAYVPVDYEIDGKLYPNPDVSITEIAVFNMSTRTFISDILENIQIGMDVLGYSSAEDTIYMGGEKIAVETETTSDYDSVVELYKLKISGETITAEKVMTIAENLKNSEDFVSHLQYSFGDFKFDNDGRMYISYSSMNVYDIKLRSTSYLMTIKNGEVIKEIEQEPYFEDKSRPRANIAGACHWFYGNQYYFIISYSDIRDYMTFGKSNLATGEVSLICDLDMPARREEGFTAVPDGTGGFHCLTTLAGGGYMYFRIS